MLTLAHAFAASERFRPALAPQRVLKIVIFGFVATVKQLLEEVTQRPLRVTKGRCGAWLNCWFTLLWARAPAIEHDCEIGPVDDGVAVDVGSWILRARFTPVLQQDREIDAIDGG